MLMEGRIEDCIEICNICRDECEETLFQHCLEMGGEHVEQRHVTLMVDCVDICQTAAKFMLRDSGQHNAVCGVCADICEACADSCEGLEGEKMQACAETCRNCAQSCREMSGGGMRGRSGTLEQGISGVA